MLEEKVSWFDLKGFSKEGMTPTVIQIVNDMVDTVNMFKIESLGGACDSQKAIRQFSERDPGVSLIVRVERKYDDRAGEEDEYTCKVFAVARYDNASGIVEEDKIGIELHTWDLDVRGVRGVDNTNRNHLVTSALIKLMNMKTTTLARFESRVAEQHKAALERDTRVAEHHEPKVADSASKGGRNDQRRGIFSVLSRWRNNGRA